MLDRGPDQADGLRRMFGGVRTRVLELVSGVEGVGRTSVAVNLAAALARSGRSTLLVDFVPDPDASKVHRYLGLQGAAPAQARSMPSGFGVLAVSHREWMETGPVCANALAHGRSSRLPGAGHDWVLVNGASLEPVVTADDGGRDVLLVLSSAGASITEAYALVKRMQAADSRCRYRVLVNRVRSAEAAHRIFRNVAQAARGYLDVRLSLIGFVPADPAMERAAAEGASVFEHDPASEAARAFGRIADAVSHWTPSRALHAQALAASDVAMEAP